MTEEAFDWPPQGSAIGLPDGVQRQGSTGQWFEVKNGEWVRVRHISDPDIKEAIRRFMSYVEVLPNGCHFWTGARSRGKGNKKWYGSFKYKGQSIRAHRFACDVIGGKVCPPGWHRDHCVFSLCVNPEHINPMPREKNQELKVERVLINFSDMDRSTMRKKLSGEPLSDAELRSATGYSGHF